MSGLEQDAPGAVISKGLLTVDDGPAVSVLAPEGTSPFFLVCEHASNRIPAQLGSLGLSTEALARHIAFDLGAAELARTLSRSLDAHLILQNFSRLVCDCNRAVHDRDFILSESDGVHVADNVNLHDAGRRSRIEEIYAPFHDAIAAALAARLFRRQPTWLIAIHSFTPTLGGKLRPWDVGLLYEKPSPLLTHLLARLRAPGDLFVGDNQPYALTAVYSETMHRHGTLANIGALEVEVRQDHLATQSMVAAWAARLSAALDGAIAAIGTP